MSQTTKNKPAKKGSKKPAVELPEPEIQSPAVIETAPDPESELKLDILPEPLAEVYFPDEPPTPMEHEPEVTHVEEASNAEPEVTSQITEMATDELTDRLPRAEQEDQQEEAGGASTEFEGAGSPICEKIADGPSKESPENVECESENVVPTPRTKERMKKLKGDVSPRYLQACAEVSRLRREFLAALDEKAGLLGVQRKGEAVPLNTVALDDLNAQIMETRRKLEDLLRQKREIRLPTDELKAINKRINGIRRDRNDARKEKAAAYQEALQHGHHSG